jgi:UDP-glucose 4-epimerase
MRVLITGGNGYVGRPLTRLLLSRGLEICVADCLRYGSWRFSPAERERLRLERLDIRDDPGMRHLLAQFVPDVVIHLAATHYIPECEQEPVQTVSVNVLGTLSLLQLCPEGCRFVLASSGAVYQPADKPHREDQQTAERGISAICRSEARSPRGDRPALQRDRPRRDQSAFVS